MKDSKILKYILSALLGCSGILSIAFFSGFINEGIMINWTYALLVIALLAAVVFPVIFMIQNISKAINSLIGIASLVILFIISFVISSGEEYVDINGKVLATAKESVISEAGITLFYIMGIGVILVILYTEVSKAIK